MVKRLSEESLIEYYLRAKKMNLDPLFLQILKDEIEQRKNAEKESPPKEESEENK